MASRPQGRGADGARTDDAGTGGERQAGVCLPVRQAQPAVRRDQKTAGFAPVAGLPAQEEDT